MLLALLLIVIINTIQGVLLTRLIQIYDLFTTYSDTYLWSTIFTLPLYFMLFTPMRRLKFVLEVALAFLWIYLGIFLYGYNRVSRIKKIATNRIKKNKIERVANNLFSDTDSSADNITFTIMDETLSDET